MRPEQPEEIAGGIANGRRILGTDRRIVRDGAFRVLRVVRKMTAAFDHIDQLTTGAVEALAQHRSDSVIAVHPYVGRDELIDQLELARADEVLLCAFRLAVDESCAEP